MASASPGGIQVQSILYGNDARRVVQSVAHLARASDLAIARGAVEFVDLVYGDCSPEPVFGPEALAQLRQRFPEFRKIDYFFFSGNLGSARGHNELLGHLAAEFALIMNPDVMVAPDALIELRRPFDGGNVAMVEARQMPIEHPKEYDKTSGETGWATTACALIDRGTLAELGGFDAESFFLYCDDVDFSWRARLAGKRVIFQPSAAVFHDKRLSPDGQWQPTSAEKYYSAEAALMLAHKFSRPEIVATILDIFRGSSVDHLEKAAALFERRRESNTLPAPIDAAHKVGEFRDGMYARHRFAL